MANSVRNGFLTLNRLLKKKDKKGKMSKATSCSNISTLDTSHLYNKVVPLAASTNAPFEQTFRIKIFLPRDQLYVVRVGAKTKLINLLETVCYDKQLDMYKYEFQHPGNPYQVFDNELSVGEVGFNEIRLAPKSMYLNSINSNHNNNFDESNNHHLQMEFHRNSLQVQSSSFSSTMSLNSSDSSRHTPIAPIRKKRLAPRPPQNELHNSNGYRGATAAATLQRESTLSSSSTTTTTMATETLSATPMSRNKLFVSSPNLSAGASDTQVTSDTKDHHDNHHNVEYYNIINNNNINHSNYNNDTTNDNDLTIVAQLNHQKIIINDEGQLNTHIPDTGQCPSPSIQSLNNNNNGSIDIDMNQNDQQQIFLEPPVPKRRTHLVKKKAPAPPSLTPSPSPPPVQVSTAPPSPTPPPKLPVEVPTAPPRNIQRIKSNEMNIQQQQQNINNESNDSLTLIKNSDSVTDLKNDKNIISNPMDTIKQFNDIENDHKSITIDHPLDYEQILNNNETLQNSIQNNEIVENLKNETKEESEVLTNHQKDTAIIKNDIDLDVINEKSLPKETPTTNELEKIIASKVEPTLIEPNTENITDHIPIVVDIHDTRKEYINSSDIEDGYLGNISKDSTIDVDPNYLSGKCTKISESVEQMDSTNEIGNEDHHAYVQGDPNDAIESKSVEIVVQNGHEILSNNDDRPSSQIDINETISNMNLNYVKYLRINRSDSFHSTCLDHFDKLNDRNDINKSIKQTNTIKNEDHKPESNRRKSTSELVSMMPSLQSLLVMKSILSNSLKAVNNVVSDTTNSIDNKDDAHNDHDDIENSKPILSKSIQISKNTLILPPVNAATKLPNANSTTNNGTVELSRDSESEHIDMVNHEHKAITDDETKENDYKRWTYQGPPSINVSTWKERPKSKIIIKSDKDYIFGSARNYIDRIGQQQQQQRKSNETQIDDAQSAPFVSFGYLEMAKRLPTPQKNLPTSEATSNCNSLPSVNIVNNNEQQQPLSLTSNIDEVDSICVKRNESISYGQVTLRRTGRTQLMDDEKKCNSLNTTNAIRKSDSFLLPQVTLRKTGLKDKMLAEPSLVQISPQKQQIQAASTLTPPPPPPPKPQQLHQQQRPSSQLFSSNKISNCYNKNDTEILATESAQTKSNVMESIRFSTPIIRSVTTKNNLTIPVGPRDQLLDSIRSFNRNNLKKKSNSVD